MMRYLFWLNKRLNTHTPSEEKKGLRYKHQKDKIFFTNCTFFSICLTKEFLPQWSRWSVLLYCWGHKEMNFQQMAASSKRWNLSSRFRYIHNRKTYFFGSVNLKWYFVEWLLLNSKRLSPKNTKNPKFPNNSHFKIDC